MLKPLIYLPFICLVILLFLLNITITGENHYVYLAQALTHGSFSYLVTPPDLTDVAVYQGKYFWVNGPFPALLSLPFVLLFDVKFQETLLKIPLNILNFALVYKISTALKLSREKALLVSFFYIFGSTYTPAAVIPFSVYFSAIVANTSLLLAIYEFLNKKRPLFMGLALATASLTRFVPILASIFFVLQLFKKPASIKQVIYLLTPIFAALLFLAFYNYLRFDNFAETGHNFQMITQEADARRQYGLFSPQHISANLFYMLLNSPNPVLAENVHVFKPPYLKPDYYGMSLFLLSPILFLLFRLDLKDKLTKTSLITILAMLIPILTHYGIGWWQIGYWHALDFIPFLLVALIPAVKKTSLRSVAILTLAGIIITWFFIIETLPNYQSKATAIPQTHFAPPLLSTLAHSPIVAPLV